MVSAGRGGPVLNIKGQVIGIAAESADQQGGLGFAIEQAIAAAHEMKFKPALRNGVAVPFWMLIQVEFNLR